MQKIGLLAGVGRLPVDFAFCARNLGLSVVTIAVLPTVESDLAEASSVYHQIGVGQLQLLIDTLRQEEVSQVTMLGKVTKELLFSGNVELDGRFQQLLASLPDQKDDTILLALVQELAKEGIQVADQTALLKISKRAAFLRKSLCFGRSFATNRISQTPKSPKFIPMMILK